ISAILAARSQPTEAQDIGLLQLLYYFGMFGASIFFVQCLVVRGLRRITAILVSIVTVLPYVYGGTRHLLLYIALPVVVICPRIIPRKWSATRLGAATAVMIMLLAVFQLQFTLRDVGWSHIGTVSIEDFTQANTTGQFGALLFAEYLVPDMHDYFMEPA